MTRQRKEIYKEMDQLYREESAEYELGCGFFSKEISEAFAPAWNRLHEKMAATYGMTVKELDDRRFQKQNEAYEAGRIPWSPCYGM